MNKDAAPAEKYLSRKEAARFLSENGFPISDRTLARMACRKPAEGPPYHRFGWHSVSYPVSGLLAWAAAHIEICGTNLLVCPSCPHVSTPRPKDNPDLLFCREASKMIGNRRLVSVTPSWCPISSMPF